MCGSKTPTRRSPAELKVSPLPALGPSSTVTLIRSLLIFAQSNTGRVVLVFVVVVCVVVFVLVTPVCVEDVVCVLEEVDCGVVGSDDSLSGLQLSVVRQQNQSRAVIWVVGSVIFSCLVSLLFV